MRRVLVVDDDQALRDSVREVMMPVMDGEEFLRRRQHVPRLSRVPVVVFSASKQRRPDGIQGWLRKPVELEVLLLTVAQCCTGAAL